MYAKIDNGTVIRFPYAWDDILRDNAGSTISNLSDDVMKLLGIVRVVVTGAPEHPATHTAEMVGCVFNREKLRWETAFTIRPLTKAEIEAKADEVRAQRNNKLARSDWTQGKDIPDSVSTPWATYRQELRDLTAQKGFPFNVVWPQEP